MSETGRGLVMVYTGNGKGKTTAALGLALRAAGHGQRILMIQFMKGDPSYGEVQAASKYLPGFTVIQSGLPSFVDRRNPSAQDLELAAQGLERARQAVTNAEAELIILDEINVALSWGLITLDQVLELIRSKPAEVNLVLTGRNAHSQVIDLADLVSEVREVKHHYRAGVKAQKGIEY